MTPTQLDHLRAIDAHIDALLALAAKRTPGEWTVTQGVYDYSPEATQFPEGPSTTIRQRRHLV